jgi:drug/metabolite transporter (DMT)-like permease
MRISDKAGLRPSIQNQRDSSGLDSYKRPRMLPAALTTLLFSLSAICSNRTAKLMGGIEANFWRLSFGSLLLGIYGHTLGMGLSGAALPIFLFSGCVGFGVGDMALFQALPRLGSRLSVMLTLCLSSPLAALMEWWWLRTRLSGAEILCGGVILAGVAVALAPARREGPVQPGLVAGWLFGGVAAFCQGAGAVLSRKAFALASQAGDPIDGVTAAYQRILGGLAFGAVFLLASKRHALWTRLRGAIAENGHAHSRSSSWRKALPWMLASGLAGPTLGVSCYQWALKTTPTGVVLPIVAITPLVIIPFSYRLEGERPTKRSLAGGALAVAGALALAWAKNR